MKEKYLKVTGVSIIAVFSVAMICFAGGCKSQPPQENPIVPAPVVQPIPAAPVVAPAPLPAVPVVPVEPVKYTVEKGDSFWKIAKKFGVNMQELAAYNNMSIDKPLKIGVTLKIPPKAAK